MRTIITTIALGLTLALGAAGCSDDKGGNSCDAVADHYLEVAPPEFKKQIGDKKQLVERCEEKMTEEDRTCTLAAEDMKGIMECAAKAKAKAKKS